MTVTTPADETHPPGGPSDWTELIKLVDRALGSRPRFRRLVILLAVVVSLIGLFMLLLALLSLTAPHFLGAIRLFFRGA